jgi:alpha-tubulin suppressor-like RCC1 family protein
VTDAIRIRPVVLVIALLAILANVAAAQPPGTGPEQRLATGSTHSLGANPDGTLWVVGSNGNGQLGTGNYTPYRTPTLVTSVSNVVAVAAGNAHSLALTADGIVRAFGANAHGQVDGSLSTRPSPVAVPLTDVIAIAAGDDFSMALRANGDVYVGQ